MQRNPGELGPQPPAGGKPRSRTSPPRFSGRSWAITLVLRAALDGLAAALLREESLDLDQITAIVQAHRPAEQPQRDRRPAGIPA